MRVLLVTVGNNANDSCKMPLRNSSYPVQMLTIRHARIYFRRDRGNVFTDVYDTIRYETTGCLTCAQKLPRVSLICRTQPKTKKSGKEKK